MADGATPAIIVIDIYFPNDGRLWGGARVAEDLTKIERLKHTRLIAYSNFAYHISIGDSTDKEFESVRTRIAKNGVTEFIDKSMTGNGVLIPNPLRRWLSGSRASYPSWKESNEKAICEVS